MNDKEIIAGMEKFMKPPYWNPIIKECFYSVLSEQREELVRGIEGRKMKGNLNERGVCYNDVLDSIIDFLKKQ